MKRVRADKLGENLVEEPSEKDRYVSNEAEMELGEDFGGEFTAEELNDFLSADVVEVKADPAFKEDLRKRLWTLVSDRYGRGPSRNN